MTPEQLQERENRLRKAFIENDFGDAVTRLSGAAEAGLIENKDAFLKSSAVAGWAGAQMGRPVNPASPDWQGIKDGIARGYFKRKDAQNVTDEEIFTAIADDYKAQDAAFEAAKDAAARGESWLGKFREKEAASPAMAGGRQASYLGMTRQIHDAFRQKILPYKATIDSVTAKAKAIQSNPEGFDWGGMADELVRIPKEDRPFVLEAISRQAAQTAETGVAQNLMINFDRGLERYLDTAVAGLERFGESPVGRFMRQAQGFDVEAQTPEQVEQRAQYLDLRDDLRGIATGKLAKLNDVRLLGMNLSGAARNAAMTLGAFVPYVGPAAMVGSFARETANEIRQQNPTMSREDAEQIAMVSAPFQAATEVVSERLLFGKLPSLKRLFTQPVFSAGGVAAQVAARVGVGTGTEISEELTQGVIPRVVQALKDDVPAVDWDGYFSDFAEQSPEMLAEILPMALLGAGVGQLSDYRAGKELIQNRDLLVAAKLTPEDADAISSAAQAGDFGTAESLLKAAWPKIAKAGEGAAEVRSAAIQSHFERSKQLAAANAQATAEAEAMGVAAIRDASGWKVRMADGTTVPVESAEAAARMQKDMVVAASEYEAETTIAAVDELLRLDPTRRVEITSEVAQAGENGLTFTNPITGQTREVKDTASLQNLRDEQMALASKEGETDVAQTILGMNKFEYGNAISTIFQRSLNKDGTANIPRIITALHEHVEASWRKGVALGKFTEQESRNAVATLISQLDPKRLGKRATQEELNWFDRASRVAKGDGDENLLREVISELAVRTWIGRDKTGERTGMTPGTILRALDSAVLTARKPAEMTLLRRLRAWVKAVGAYLRGVVATAKIISQAEQNGTVGDFTEFMDKLLGLTEQTREDAAQADQIRQQMEADGMAFSLSPITPAQDAEYMAAVKAGDTDKAQRMVDEAAKAAGFILEAFHGTSGVFNAFDSSMGGKVTQAKSAEQAFFLVDDPTIADQYARFAVEETGEGSERVISARLKGNFKTVDHGGRPYQERVFAAEIAQAKQEGFDGVRFTNTNDAVFKGDIVGYEPAPKATITRSTDGRGFLLERGNVKAKATTLLNGFTRIEYLNGATDLVRSKDQDQVLLAFERTTENLVRRKPVYRQGRHTVFAVFNPYQIKSADPVTYDDAGNVIPLSQRFNPESADIRFSLSPTSSAEQLANIIESIMQARPELAFKIRQRSLSDINRLIQNWSAERVTWKGDKIRPVVEKRTKASLDKEQAMRQANALDRILQDKGFSSADALRSKDSKDYEAWQRFQESKDLLLKNGMDEAEAEKLASASSSTWRKNFVKAIKESITQAKSEAQQWRDETEDMMQDDWSPRESLQRDARLFNTAMAAFPAEIRGKIVPGGMVKLTGQATERARYKTIEKAMQKAVVELEKFMQKEITAEVDSLLDRYSSQKGASGRMEGKLLSNYTELVDYANFIRNADIETVANEEKALDAAIADSQDADETASLMSKMGVLRQFELWSDKDSASMADAMKWLQDIVATGKLGKKILDEERKAMLDELRGDAIKGALPDREVSQAEADNETTAIQSSNYRKAAQALRGMMSSILWTTAQRLELLFGEDSKVTRFFADRLVSAANQETDILRNIDAQRREALSVIFDTESTIAQTRAIGKMQTVKKSGVSITEGRKTESVKLDIETLTKLSDGTMTAEAAGLRQDQVDAALEEWAASDRKRTVTVEKVLNAGELKPLDISEMQGIQYLLWSRQDASRKQMERDGWTEDSFRQLDDFLSPQAVALANWMASSYDAAAKMIDPVYRRLFNAPLPRIKNYAPIYRHRSGDASVMELDGSDISSGMTAGFTKSRVNTISPLMRMDAMAVFLGHWQNVAHWVSHAEIMRDTKAVLLDKNVQTAIRQKSGDASLTNLKTNIANIEAAGTRAVKDIVFLSRFWQNLMQYRAFKALAFRFSPVVKQTSAVLNPLLADVPAHAYSVGLARALTSPVEFVSDVSAMWKSDIIQRRIQGGFSAEARVAMQNAGVNGSMLISMMQKGMLPMAWTDAGWTAIGSAIAFDYYRRSYLAENSGATAEQADAYASQRIERMIATSAQPSDLVNRSIAEQSTNIFAKAMWMFLSDQRKAAAIELMAIKRLASGKSKNKAMDIQRILVAHVAQAAVTQLSVAILASVLGKPEDEEREWSREQWAASLALGPVGGIFVLGRGIEYGVKYLLGLRVFGETTLTEKVASDVYRAGRDINDLFSDDPEDVVNELDKLSSATGSVLAPIFGPQAGSADVMANLAREARKIGEAVSREE